MKLLSGIIILFLIQTSVIFPQEKSDSTKFNSKFSYKITNMSLEDALIYIANKSNVNIAYNNDLIPKNKKINLNLENITADQAFKIILEDSGVDVLKLDNNKYILRQKESKKKVVSGFGSLRGVISDSTNGEVLAFGNVLVKELNRGASTNDKGLFLITSIPAPGEYTLVVTYVGYDSKSLKVTVNKDKITHVNFPLIPNSIELQTVEKIGERVAESNATDLGLQRIAIKDLEKLPQGVETDIFRSIQYIPGVKSTGDISARYYVRGSPSNQNLILLNDIPVYHPFHALGMFSAIDPEMINNIEFYKGGFTSEYSGRLSSVMRLITKDGNKNKLAGKASGSLLTAKGVIEGPLPSGSFIMTGRKSYNTDILKKFLNDKNVPVNFYDVSLKLNYANNNFLHEGKFSLFGFASQDNLNNNNPLEADFKWANRLLGFKWFQLSDSPLFYEVSFSVSNFEAETIPNLSSVKAKKNELTDLTLKMDFTYVYDNKNELDVGIKIKEVSSELILENTRGNLKDISGPKGANISAFAKYKILANENVGIDIGSRINLTRIATGRAGEFLLEPRISTTFRLLPTIALKFAWGVYNQELITLSDEDELISIFEPWFITPSYLDPSQAIHYVAGLEFDLTKNLSIDLEAYFKNLENFSALNDEKYFETDPDLVNGSGESKGIEFSLNYTPFPFRFNIGYSYSEATKTANGLTYPPRYDSRHSFNSTFEYNIGNGWYASISWVYFSGLPFTQIVGYQDRLIIDNIFTNETLLANYRPYTLHGKRNDARLPDYHRLDFNLSKNIDLKFLKLYLDLSLINIYDRDNIFYFDRETGKRVNMLPFLPTASVKVEF